MTLWPISEGQEGVVTLLEVSEREEGVVSLLEVSEREEGGDTEALYVPTESVKNLL